MDNETMRIPVMGAMRKGKDGEWHLCEEESEYMDITPDQFARFLIHKFGKDTIFNGKGAEV